MVEFASSTKDWCYAFQLWTDLNVESPMESEMPQNVAILYSFLYDSLKMVNP